jgi:group II intron reverse transcriptase/maturase
MVGIQRRKVNWILDADYRSFFDTVSHSWLLRFLEHRIGDERILRLIRKWLKAGVLEEGIVTESEAGTPQGATASPLLANVYLHYVFDLWAQQWRKRHARGDMIVVRYADDSVVGFEHEADAQQFLAEMRKRSEAFSLSIHPAKTRIIRFGRFAALNRKERGQGKPETFNFLGFTMICGQKRRGGFQLRRRTRRDRMQATIQRVKGELQRRRHQPIPGQGRWLGQVVKGYYAYHAVPTNYQALVVFRARIAQLWRRALTRRSQRGRRTWKRMLRLMDAWLPRPRILHPWPERRFAVTHPRWEPCARIGPARLCAGGAQ